MKGVISVAILPLLFLCIASHAQQDIYQPKYEGGNYQKKLSIELLSENRFYPRRYIVEDFGFAIVLETEHKVDLKPSEYILDNAIVALAVNCNHTNGHHDLKIFSLGPLKSSQLKGDKWISKIKQRITKGENVEINEITTLSFRRFPKIYRKGVPLFGKETVNGYDMEKIQWVDNGKVLATQYYFQKNGMAYAIDLRNSELRESLDHFHLLADVGDIKSIYAGAWEKEISKDYEGMIRDLRRAADFGHTKAQRSLGQHLMEGKLCKQDLLEGINYLDLVIEAGDVTANQYLGNFYWHTDSKYRVFNRANDYYEAGCDEGDEFACQSKKLLAYERNNYKPYLDSSSLALNEENYVRARAMLLEATKGDFLDSYALLGMLYLKGLGGAKNTKIAADYFHKVINIGTKGFQLHSSLEELGKLYIAGDGVEKNVELGIQYLNRSYNSYKLSEEKDRKNQLGYFIAYVYLDEYPGQYNKRMMGLRYMSSACTNGYKKACEEKSKFMGN